MVEKDFSLLLELLMRPSCYLSECAVTADDGASAAAGSFIGEQRGCWRGQVMASCSRRLPAQQIGSQPEHRPLNGSPMNHSWNRRRSK